jgi:hypothetical protein
VYLSCVFGVVAQPWRRAETLVLSLVLVWPLCGSGGEGGSRVPLAFGWEVPVSIQRSASGSGKERGTQGARYAARSGDVFESWRKTTVWFKLVK